MKHLAKTALIKATFLSEKKYIFSDVFRRHAILEDKSATSIVVHGKMALYQEGPT